KLDNTNEVSMNDVLMSATIKDGRLSVKPFDVKFGSYKTTVAGSTGVDGSIDYKLKMDVPAGKLGSQFNSFVSGGKSDPNAMVPINIGLGGSFLSPSPKLLMTEQKQQVKEAATTVVKDEAKKQGDKLIGELIGKPKADSTKTDSTKTQSTTETIKKEAANKIQNLLKKKKP
ncbi:MAG TPA: AsmA-like C-terminal region-containing protein, partial [Cyclobacteriaceae bacterium]|nr:AsmA-like C-terminal region-containing protein [Cyclobacteriaceae bacterium]